MYDYPALITKYTSVLKEAEGRVLRNAIVHIVQHEYNTLSLQLDDNWYCATGAIGSEILQFYRHDDPIFIENSGDGSFHQRFEPFECFFGHTVVAARQIGEAWNGHGFEFSFSGMPDKTLLVQSIYTGSQFLGFSDCIRLGIGQYWYDAERQLNCHFKNHDESQSQ